MSDASKSYDRLMAALDGLPDCARSRPTTVRVIPKLVGGTETFIVQTFRQKDEGDTIFIEHTGPEGYERYYLPPDVVRVIVRHRDQLEAHNRRRAGRRVAEERKAAGLRPAFLRPGHPVARAEAAPDTDPVYGPCGKCGADHVTEDHEDAAVCAATFQSKHGEPVICTRSKGHGGGHAGDLDLLPKGGAR